MARMKEYLMDMAETLAEQTGASYDDVERLLFDGRIDLADIAAAEALPPRKRAGRLRGLVAVALLFEDIDTSGRYRPRRHA